MPRCCAARAAASEAEELATLAPAMRRGFQRHLIRDGTVAGYAIFDPGRGEPELLLHPSDKRTGLKYLAPANDAAASSPVCSRRNRRSIISS